MVVVVGEELAKTVATEQQLLLEMAGMEQPQQFLAHP
jgi:hypothetical protein